MLILKFLWVESEQKLHLKVDCSNYSPVRDFAIYPTYLLYLLLYTELSIENHL